MSAEPVVASSIWVKPTEDVPVVDSFHRRSEAQIALWEGRSGKIGTSSDALKSLLTPIAGLSETKPDSDPKAILPCFSRPNGLLAPEPGRKSRNFLQKLHQRPLRHPKTAHIFPHLADSKPLRWPQRSERRKVFCDAFECLSRNFPEEKTPTAVDDFSSPRNTARPASNGRLTESVTRWKRYLTIW